MKVLIAVPDLSLHGGVAALYNVLKLDVFYKNIEYFNVNGKLPLLLRTPINYISFIIKLRNTDVVHLNPSLNSKSIYRDSFYALFTLIFGKKLLVYWHGWDVNFEERIIKNKLLSFLFSKTLLKANTTVVLGKIFEQKIKDLGFKNKIVIETGCFDDIYNNIKLPKELTGNKEIILLFLSRLEKEKGIYIAIETLRILNSKNAKYKLIITGNGSESENVKKYINSNDNIELVGHVSEEFKYSNLLLKSDILFFPTYYPEGMPLSIIEGISFGLPIISRPIGGIPDIVKNENGVITDSLEPKIFADIISDICNDKEKYHSISECNTKYAKKFEPKIVRERIYSYYTGLMT